MIASLPRPLAFDAPQIAQAASGLHAPSTVAPDRRPQPVEAAEPGARVRRDQPGVVPRLARDADAEAWSAAASDAALASRDDAVRVKSGPFGWLGLDSTPFMAQLVGQDATPRDPVAAGRSQTSFRRSPVELYEEVQGWGRRVDYLFVFEGMVSAAAA